MFCRFLTISFFCCLCTEITSQPVSVGSYSVELRPGLNLVGMLIDNGQSNKVETLFTNSVPEGAAIHKLVSGSFTTNVLEESGWERPDERIEVGEGVFIRNPETNVVVASFGGEIRTGDLTNAIPAGLSIQAPKGPVKGRLTQDLGLRLSAFDNVYLLIDGELKVFTHLPDGKWRPAEPVLRVGEAFLVNAARSTNWVLHIEP